MAKTPSKKTAKTAKAATGAKKGKRAGKRTESYSSYIYKVRPLEGSRAPGGGVRAVCAQRRRRRSCSLNPTYVPPRVLSIGYECRC
jgi:hypothetical protein